MVSTLLLLLLLRRRGTFARRKMSVRNVDVPDVAVIATKENGDILYASILIWSQSYNINLVLKKTYSI